MPYEEFMWWGLGALGLFILLVAAFGEDLWDFFPGFLLTGAALLAGISLLAIFGVLNYEKNACEEYGESLRIEARYDGNTGCWAEIEKDRWVNLDNYRETTQHPAVLG